MSKQLRRVSELTPEEKRKLREWLLKVRRRGGKLDLHYRSKRVPVFVETWMRHPERYDIPGVDTPEVMEEKPKVIKKTIEVKKERIDYEKVAQEFSEKYISAHKRNDEKEKARLIQQVLEFIKSHVDEITSDPKAYKYIDIVMRTIGEHYPYSADSYRVYKELLNYIHEVIIPILTSKFMGTTVTANDLKEMEEYYTRARKLFEQIGELEDRGIDISDLRNTSEHEILRQFLIYPSDFARSEEEVAKRGIPSFFMTLITIEPLGMGYFIHYPYGARDVLKLIFFKKHRDEILRALNVFEEKLKKKFSETKNLIGRFKIIEEQPRKLVLEDVETGDRINMRFSASTGTRFTGYAPFLGATRAINVKIIITSNNEDLLWDIAHKLKNYIEEIRPSIDIQVKRGKGRYTITLKHVADTFHWSPSQREEREKDYEKTISTVIDNVFDFLRQYRR